MGYRIEYDSGEGKYQVLPERKSRVPAFTTAALAGFLLMTHLFWPAGEDAIRDFLIPGEDAVTIAAAECMAAELREGASLQDALESFCRQIIQHESDLP